MKEIDITVSTSQKNDEQDFIKELANALSSEEVFVRAFGDTFKVEKSGSFRFEAGIHLNKSNVQKALQLALTNLLRAKFGKRFIDASVGFTSDDTLEVSGNVRALTII